jgi:hypothetical protein
VAVGYFAGANTQGNNAVAVGNEAGRNTQGARAVAIGNMAGNIRQLFGAVAIGDSAGYTGQGQEAVAIGRNAALTGQGTYAVAIGYAAGYQNQPQKSIVINASGSIFSGAVESACYIRPVRALAAATAVYYNASTFEVSYLTSSRTTKNTIEDLTMDTSVLHDLRPRTFIYNSDPDAGKQIGYIAEEVAEINGHFATYNEPNGSPAAINWNALSVFLVEEVKKLKRENEDLRARVLALENR